MEAQMVAPEVGPVFNLISKNLQFTWDNFSNTSGSTKQLLMDRNRLSIRSGLLYRKWEDKAGRGFWYQLVLPSKYRQEVMTYLHDRASAGHLGGKKTYHKVRARFYWPVMRQFIQRWVLTCEVCQQRKGPPKKPKGKMQEYLVGAPNERVAVDIMGPYSMSDNNNQWLLVIGDLFTRYCVAVPLPDFTATTVAEAKVINWVALFGVPLELHTEPPILRVIHFVVCVNCLEYKKQEPQPLDLSLMGSLKGLIKQLITYLTVSFKTTLSVGTG